MGTVSSPWAHPKRSEDQREKDYVAIAEMYLRGSSQQVIGEKIGVSRQQISADLKVIRQRWQRSTLRDFDAKKSEELARIDNLEATYWQAWEDSKREIEKRSSKKRDGEGGYQEAGIQRETPNVGDPRFLQGVERCIEQRCKIFGFYAPTKIDISEIDSLLAAEFARVAGIAEAADAGTAEDDAELGSEAIQ